MCEWLKHWILEQLKSGGMATDTSVNQNFKSIYGIFGGGGGN